MRWGTALLMLFASTAMADVITEDYEAPRCPPLTCPPGSLPGGGGGHGECPVGCMPGWASCTTDAECHPQISELSRCVDTRFCTEPVFAGRVGDVDIIRGEPDAEGNCTTGTPTIAKRCTFDRPPPTPSASSSSSSSSSGSSSSGEDEGCSTSGRFQGFSWMVLLLLLRRPGKVRK